ILTIPEGWNIRDIDYYLKTRGFAQDNEFLQASNGDYSAEFSFLKDNPKNLNLEGFLFPDTYHLRAGDDSETLVRKMLDNFDKKLAPELKLEIDNQGKTVFEIINMASLLEEEVLSAADKRIVAGILWKRIELNMFLNVDASLVYGLGRKISGSDTKTDFPYNTYKYKGLPPGPISNPGLDSILAAIYPEKSPYLYYLSTSDGKTIFGKTLEEHNRAVVKYLK
ncbi:endolytic transglycosylase MltG, partial [Patescibacteria group bacterium]|nr:endolytic transglycosylase MltG [Patescibacteria group bacterium]